MTTGTMTVPIEAAVLERLLQPYRDNCRYVFEASLTHARDKRAPRLEDPESWVTLHGRCGVGGSCYIDDTGHFNAVEFNITYNQLLYAGLAGAVQHGLLPELRHWDLEEYWRRQLPDVLIVDYHVRFPRPMRAHAFTGRFEIREVVPKPHKQLLLLRTGCRMDGERGGYSEADVLIALVRM